MKLRHITLGTAKLEESVRFYQEVCGLTVQRELRGTPTLVFPANAEGETEIELMEAPERAYAGDGISIGFSVPDADAAYAELGGKDYTLGPLLSPRPGAKFFFVTDPNGLQVQLVSYQ